jgi:hypothetical protein
LIVPPAKNTVFHSHYPPLLPSIHNHHEEWNNEEQCEDLLIRDPDGVILAKWSKVYKEKAANGNAPTACGALYL